MFNNFLRDSSYSLRHVDFSDSTLSEFSFLQEGTKLRLIDLSGRSRLSCGVEPDHSIISRNSLLNFLENLILLISQKPLNGCLAVTQDITDHCIMYCYYLINLCCGLLQGHGSI